MRDEINLACLGTIVVYVNKIHYNTGDNFFKVKILL